MHRHCIDTDQVCSIDNAHGDHKPECCGCGYTLPGRKPTPTERHYLVAARVELRGFGDERAQRQSLVSLARVVANTFGDEAHVAPADNLPGRWIGADVAIDPDVRRDVVAELAHVPIPADEPEPAPLRPETVDGRTAARLDWKA